MPGQPRGNLIIGAATLVIAALLLLVWIPLDSGTGVIQTVRRRAVIGDAMAPSIAGMFLVIGAVLLLTAERRAEAQPLITRASFVFALWAAGLLAVSLLIMRWSGPLAAALAGLDYRPLRDTYPWKLTGYFFGGSFLVAGFVFRAGGRASWAGLGIAVLAVLVLIALYDLPFDDLLLPPNGDV